MQRRTLMLGTAAGLGDCLAGRAFAQQQRKVRRVALFSIGIAATSASDVELFKRGMRERGWVEGANVEYLTFWSEGKLDRLEAFVTDMVARGVDVLVPTTVQSALIAQKVTRTVPIVVVVGSDIVRSGLVQSLARPGGNVTGLTTIPEETVGKIIEILHEALPRVMRLALLVNPTLPASETMTTRAESLAKAFKLTLIRVTADTPAQIEVAFSKAVGEKAQAIVVGGDAMLYSQRELIATLARKARLPSGFVGTDYAAAGGLLTYAPNLGEIFRYAASYVDRVFKGSHPRDLPVEQPRQFEFIINLKTARELGVQIPKEVMLRADRVIE